MDGTLAPRRPVVLALGALFAGFLGLCWAAFGLAWIAGWRAGWVDAGLWRLSAEEAAHWTTIPEHVAFALCGVLAYAIWSRRAWARPLLAGSWLVFAVAAASEPGANAVSALSQGALYSLLTGLYLYTAPAVRAYFAAPQQHEPS